MTEFSLGKAETLGHIHASGPVTHCNHGVVTLEVGRFCQLIPMLLGGNARIKVMSELSSKIK